MLERLIYKRVKKGYKASDKLKRKIDEAIEKEPDIVLLTHLRNTYSFKGDEKLAERIKEIAELRRDLREKYPRSKV